MSESGTQLKTARESRGLTLHQVATATKISVSVLEAIERGNFSRLHRRRFRVAKKSAATATTATLTTFANQSPLAITIGVCRLVALGYYFRIIVAKRGLDVGESTLFGFAIGRTRFELGAFRNDHRGLPTVAGRIAKFFGSRCDFLFRIRREQGQARRCKRET